MNRSDLVQLLSDRFSQLTRGDAEAAVLTILETMNSAMVRGRRIEIRGFGSFSVIHRASRMGRNPRSGAPMEIPDKPSVGLPSRPLSGDKIFGGSGVPQHCSIAP